VHHRKKMSSEEKKALGSGYIKRNETAIMGRKKGKGYEQTRQRVYDIRDTTETGDPPKLRSFCEDKENSRR